MTNTLGRTANRACIGAEFLPQPHGYGVLHVSTPGFKNLPEFFAFFLQSSG